MFILFALLPLAVNAVCSSGTLADCPNCAVGAIGQQFSYSYPCNCNDKAGRFTQMCPKTGDPHYPVCCSVDGKVATKQDCKCGETGSCSSGQSCTASTNTCAYPVCSNTDGSKVLVLENGDKCQCGTNGCSAGQECTAATNTCDFPVCSTVDGSAVATNAKTGCTCGFQKCNEGDTCTASKNECKPKNAPPTPKVLEACKPDVVTTKMCKCGAYATASVGQTCPSKGDNKDTPQWPACVGSDMFETFNRQCKCADRDICGYGQKCTQTGDFKGMCECVPGKNIGCLEKVPPTDKCPLSCDGHTTMGASAIIFDECVSWIGSLYYKSTMKSGKANMDMYSDSKCTTKADISAFGMKSGTIVTPSGCNDDRDEYMNFPQSASGSTALKVTMPALFVVGLLGFILL